MAKIAMAFGVLLVLVGGGWWVATGMAVPMALIPAVFGLLLLVCGVLANTEDAKKRMLWMHIAVTVGLLGFLFPGVRGGMEAAHWATLMPFQRVETEEQLVMAVLCLIFTALCVRSFILARVVRTA